MAVFLAICGIGCLTTSYAQTEMRTGRPMTPATLPLPFSYPSAFLRPTIDRTEHPGQNVSLGDFDITLGKTKLSTVVQTVGGELQFTPAREGFLCFSAPIVEKNSRGQMKDLSETTARQNIWLMLGRRGEISEARLEAVPNGEVACPALPLEYSNVKVASIYINEPVRELEKDRSLKPSEVPEDSDWIFWFSQKDEPKKKSQIGLFGAEKSNGAIKKIISVVETI
ncbi:MAG: hypothetical protein LUC43_02940 [Burkholderiales bacterium]|nr:hypothetical protein [Burkholderiales bacterium]